MLWISHGSFVEIRLQTTATTAVAAEPVQAEEPRGQ